MPEPIFLTAQWRHLAMVNYEIDPAVLAPHVPAGVEVDFFQGRTFVSLVGLLFFDTRLKGWAIPWHRDFEEVNLRCYVRRTSGGEVRRGVIFIKEIVPRSAVTLVARTLYGENYVTHPMRHQVSESDALASAAYEWKQGGRWHRLCVHGEGPPEPAAPDSEEQFITEHYWGYTKQRDNRALEYQVAHPSWQLWRNCAAEVDCDAASLYGESFAAAMSRPPSSCLVADGSAISVHRGKRI